MKIYDLAIIGGGPGGIGAAVEAVVLGIKDIVLVEKGDNHSQTIRKFYKDNKRVDKDYKGQVTELLGNVDFSDGTKETTLDLFDTIISEHKIDVRFNTEVEKIKKGGAMFDLIVAGGVITAKRVIVSIGNMGKPNKPDYKIPPAIKQCVNFNLDQCDEGEKILVVGGGNSALEYAYDLADNHNQVTLSYRKGEFSRANPENIQIIKDYERELKMELWLNTNIIELQEIVTKASDKAHEGKGIAIKMKDGFDELNENIDNTIRLIEHVSTSSKQQHIAISQINDSISNIDQITHKNAAAAHTISSLSNDTKGLAMNLINAASYAKFRDSVTEGICDVRSVYKLNQLKLDHISFKDSSFSTLTEHAEQVVTNHHECKLGEWIDQQEQQDQPFTKTQNWQALKGYHEKVHSGVQSYVDQNAQHAPNSELQATSKELEENVLNVFKS
jgi:thioredoxin reductase (NADPH)